MWELNMKIDVKINWRRGSYPTSIAKIYSKKVGGFIPSMKFFYPGAALYLYKSTIRPYMENCCHVWAVPPSCYLELLDKLQKRICWTVGPSLAASLETLADRWNVASLSLFWADSTGSLFLIFGGGLLVILIDCMTCLSAFVDITRMSMSTVSFFAS